MSQRIKLRFPFRSSSGGAEIETMWTVKRDAGYEIDNIPFYATGVAVGDLVSAEPDADDGLRFSGLIRPSGHSTVRLWFADERDVMPTREALKKLGCSSELSELTRLVAVDVPPAASFPEMKAFFDAGEAAGTFEYEEACLGEGSRRDNGVMLRFDDAGSDLAVMLEDDGRVAYAYLLQNEKIVGDVWLYNVGEAPEKVDAKDPSQMPFQNPRRYCRLDATSETPRLHERSNVTCTWSKAGVDVRIDGILWARIEIGSKPGWSRLALHPGPVALPFEPREE